MKKLASVESSRVRRPGSGPGKTTLQKKPKGKSARLRPVRTGATAKLAGLLAERYPANPAPETVPAHLRLYGPEQPDGEWAVDLMLKPGRYEYRFIADGQWIDDPMAPGFAANPFGGLNSVMDVQPSA